MAAPPDSPIPVGRLHRNREEIEMRVYDYERGVARVTLPAGSLFQPWEPLAHWRGEEVPITLGSGATEFDWGVTSADGHFLLWDNFFSKCELVETP